MIVDGVGYTPGMIRALVRKRHQLASELTLVRDTLARRTEALNRVVAENDRLRRVRG